MDEIICPATEINLGMSNFDNEIEDGFLEALQGEPGEVFGRHSGWNFNGRVWLENGKFHEEVWVYGSPVAIYSGDSLRELMDEVNNEHGWD